MLSWWARWRAKDTYTRTILACRTPTHTQHKEIIPFSATKSLRPWSPFQCYSGVCGEESQLSSSVYVVLNPPGLSSTSGPHSPLQCSLRTKPLRACTKPSITALTGVKQLPESFLALLCPKRFHSNLQQPNHKEKHSQANMGKQRPTNNHEPTAPNPQSNRWRTCTGRKMGKE